MILDRHTEIMEEIKRELYELESSTVGWTQVEYPYGFKSRYHAIDIEMWVDENCGEFKKYGRTFYFKDEKDASVFLLRWA